MNQDQKNELQLKKLDQRVKISYALIIVLFVFIILFTISIIIIHQNDISDKSLTQAQMYKIMAANSGRLGAQLTVANILNIFATNTASQSFWQKQSDSLQKVIEEKEKEVPILKSIDTLLKLDTSKIDKIKLIDLIQKIPLNSLAKLYNEELSTNLKSIENLEVNKQPDTISRFFEYIATTRIQHILLFISFFVILFFILVGAIIFKRGAFKELSFASLFISLLFIISVLADNPWVYAISLLILAAVGLLGIKRLEGFLNKIFQPDPPGS